VKPVVALDIDGTLVDYHSHFESFAAQYFGFAKSPKAVMGGYDARLPFHKYLGVSKTAYRKCKLAYRRGELKRSVPLLPRPLPQAPELTRVLRRWGVDVWLCTTRPYLSHSEVDDATRHNLRRHGIQYQGIIWGEHKYRELVRTVGGDRVAAVLDDLPEMCRQADGLGLSTGFALRPHNVRQYATLGWPSGWPWLALENHDDTLAWLREQLDKWKADNQ
jgi:phosphoglycolate phosphatase-like HAD superfamily hydrolase